MKFAEGSADVGGDDLLQPEPSAGSRGCGDDQLRGRMWFPTFNCEGRPQFNDSMCTGIGEDCWWNPWATSDAVVRSQSPWRVLLHGVEWTRVGGRSIFHDDEGECERIDLPQMGHEGARSRSWLGWRYSYDLGTRSSW